MQPNAPSHVGGIVLESEGPGEREKREAADDLRDAVGRADEAQGLARHAELARWQGGAIVVEVSGAPPL